ncbi:MAG: hypothetical protein VZR11_07670 [Succinimonas sp.]|nr:hypothetical protein [Succinimonas sp.]
MDKDDAFLTELQVNDKVKVTVNFFGQEMPFEGTCTGITDDKLSIYTSAKPEPVELPLSEITKGEIKEKYTPPQKTPEKIINEDNKLPNDYYKYLTTNNPNYCGYIITIYNKLSHNEYHADECYYENKRPKLSFDIDNTSADIQLNDNDITIIINQLHNFTKSSFFSAFYNNNIFREITTTLKNYQRINITNNDFKDKILKSINNEFISQILSKLKEQYDSIIDINNQIELDNDDLADIDYNHKKIIEQLLQIPFYLSISIIESEKILTDLQYHNITNPSHFKLLATSIDLVYKHVFLLSEFTTKTYSLDSNGIYYTYYDHTCDFARFSNRIYFINKIINIYSQFAYIHSAIIPEYNYKSTDYFSRGFYLFIYDSPKEMELYTDIWGEALFYPRKYNEYRQSHSLTPITSQWIEQPKKYLIRFLYQNLIFSINKEVSDYYIKITNNSLDKKLKTLIKDYFLVTEPEYSAAMSKLTVIFENVYKDTFLKLFHLTNIITIYKHNLTKINNYVSDIINYFNNNSYRYLVIDHQYRNYLSDFFLRLLYSTNSDHSFRFEDSEKKMLINAEYYNYLLSPIDEEPFSTEAHEYIKQLNIWSHSKEFSEIFYKQYIRKWSEMGDVCG